MPTEVGGFSIAWLLSNSAAALLLPPGNGLGLLLLAFLGRHRFPRLALSLGLAGGLLLAVLSLPAVGNALIRHLEAPPLAAGPVQAGAIVVLGGGRYREAPEYGSDTVAAETLMRLRYAALLQRRTGLPLLVAGGAPDGGVVSEAEAMARTLKEDFRVPVRWIEGESADTRENAVNAARLLGEAGIGRVLLVSHAWHLPRAAESFRRAGLQVVPAPTAFQREAATPLDYLPQAEGLRRSRIALREWLGRFTYWLRGG